MQIYLRLKRVFFSARNIWKSGKFCYIMTIYELFTSTELRTVRQR